MSEKSGPKGARADAEKYRQYIHTEYAAAEADALRRGGTWKAYLVANPLDQKTYYAVAREPYAAAGYVAIVFGGFPVPEAWTDTPLPPTTDEFMSTLNPAQKKALAYRLKYLTE